MSFAGYFDHFAGHLIEFNSSPSSGMSGTPRVDCLFDVYMYVLTDEDLDKYHSFNTPLLEKQMIKTYRTFHRFLQTSLN